MSSQISQIYKNWAAKQERDNTAKLVKYLSYSQYKNWSVCPHLHYLISVAKEIGYTDNDYTVFGYSIHETLQKIVLEHYLDQPQKTEENFQFFLRRYQAKVNRALEKDLSEREELDADKIVKFSQSAKIYIPKVVDFLNESFKKFNVLDTELKVRKFLPFETEKYQYAFRGDIDLIIESDGFIHIIDWKTSLRGWNDYKKQDDLTLDQIKLYAWVLSSHWNVPLEKIKCHYIIINTAQSDFELISVLNTQKETDRILKKMKTMVFNVYERGFYPKTAMCGNFCECKNYYNSLTNEKEGDIND